MTPVITNLTTNLPEQIQHIGCQIEDQLLLFFCTHFLQGQVARILRFLTAARIDPWVMYCKEEHFSSMLPHEWIR